MSNSNDSNSNNSSLYLEKKLRLEKFGVDTSKYTFIYADGPIPIPEKNGKKWYEKGQMYREENNAPKLASGKQRQRIKKRVKDKYQDDCCWCDGTDRNNCCSCCRKPCCA